MEWIMVAKIKEVAKDTMKLVETKGKEIVLCNVEEKIYAFSRRCGHMNGPLEMGTLEGKILTCPLHGARFDITTGKVITGPHLMGGSLPKEVPEIIVQQMEHMGKLQAKIKTYDLETYQVRLEGDTIEVQI
ncbi:MAG: Rieske (2Fe-2S) protein [Chloroflexi bacterium]|nr:Rieske (2Fe-2S) protein [Chloroflexota bacterium]